MQGITIADPNLPDCPLMYVNEAFCRMTGYDQDEILGRNCRFLQGPETDKASLARIKVAMQQVELHVICTLSHASRMSHMADDIALAAVCAHPHSTYEIDTTVSTVSVSLCHAAQCGRYVWQKRTPLKSTQPRMMSLLLSRHTKQEVDRYSSIHVPVTAEAGDCPGDFELQKEWGEVLESAEPHARQGCVRQCRELHWSTERHHRAHTAKACRAGASASQGMRLADTEPLACHSLVIMLIASLPREQDGFGRYHYVRLGSDELVLCLGILF